MTDSTDAPRGLGHLAARGFAAGVALAAFGAAAADRDLHGSAETFAARGVSLAWGVRRGASETGAIVVIRVRANHGIYPFLSMTCSDPLSGRRQSILAATETTRPIDIRVQRGQFADCPRTELRLYPSAAARYGDRPDRVVYYLGVPAATPEFTDDGKLESWLEEGLRGARAVPESR